MGDRAEHKAAIIRGGGGIVFGGIDRSRASTDGALSDGANAIRKRWASGVAIVTAVDENGGFRGVTATSFVVVSSTPPIVAVALSSDGSFHRLCDVGTAFGLSILDRSQAFLADRFAGRAPVPDGTFTGVPHVVHTSGVPMIEDAIGWCVGVVTSRIPVGDHVLVLGELRDGGTIVDTDDPLVSYEGRYRSLEVG